MHAKVCDFPIRRCPFKRRSPVVVWRKELRADSGGAGRQRGGLGQTLEIGLSEDAPFIMSAGTMDRVLFPARGRDGGKPGAAGSFGLMSGRRFEGKHKHTVPAGERRWIRARASQHSGAALSRTVASVPRSYP